MKSEATIARLGDEHWNVVVERRDEHDRVTARQGSTLIGSETKARKFAREIGGRGTKITVQK